MYGRTIGYEEVAEYKNESRCHSDRLSLHSALCPWITVIKVDSASFSLRYCISVSNRGKLSEAGSKYSQGLFWLFSTNSYAWSIGTINR